MSPKRVTIAVAGVALVVLVAVGLVQLAGSPGSSSQPSRLTAAQIQQELSGSPAPLAALHAQAGTLLAGGLPALRSRLAELKGTPVVVNKWASWCVPCRSEFGALQAASASLGRTVAFIGIDSADTSRSAAQSFLTGFPVGYPSYYDPSGEAGSAITDSSFTPVTVFYNRSGGQYIHQGPYASAARLEADVRRYALQG